MRDVISTSCYKKALKRILKRGKDSNKLFWIIEQLRLEGSLPRHFKDHALTGNYIGSRECHIEPDWLLIYRIDNDALILEDTGSHSDLFL